MKPWPTATKTMGLTRQLFVEFKGLHKGHALSIEKTLSPTRCRRGKPKVVVRNG